MKVLLITQMRAPLIEELLTREIQHLETVIREADALSRPVEPGHWRWGDVSTDGYHRKSEAELKAMYERNRESRDRASARRSLAWAMREELRSQQ